MSSTDTGRIRRDSDADPEADDKVDSPTDLDKPSWKYVLKKTAREFSDDQCTDLAAALTYYAVLALFPAVIALTSVLGLVGQGTEAVDEVLSIIKSLGGSGVVDAIEDPLVELSQSTRLVSRWWRASWVPSGRRAVTSGPSAER
jgi:membrane protein